VIGLGEEIVLGQLKEEEEEVLKEILDVDIDHKDIEGEGLFTIKMG
jgi:hypothetical protein